MKRFIKSTILVFALIGAMIITSCETEPTISACERDKVGTVTVKNSTGYVIYTDVTWGDYVENYEKRVSNGSSTKYTNVAASGHPESYSGRIEIWVSWDGDNWSFNYENLSPCEDLTYTWYSSSAKSTGSCPFVLMLPNGDTVEPTLKAKE